MWRRLFVFFGLWTMLTLAQEPYAVHFGRKDGLPTTNVYCAMQDREGYMWFGTDIGVLRFDGATFQHYSTEDGLGDNEVFGCFQDPSGRIWFSTYNGRISYYQNGRFYNDARDKRLMRTPEPTMMLKVTGDSNGNVFFLYRNRYYISFHPKTGSRLHRNGGRSEVLDLFPYRNENLLFFRYGTYDQQKRQRFTFRKPEFRKHICRTFRWHDCLYFSDGDRLYSFDGRQQRLVADLQLHHDEIISIYIDSKEDLWLGTRNGLFRRKLHDATAGFSHLLKGHAVSSVAEDFERAVWITTLDSGVFMIPSRHMTAIKKKDGSDIVVNCLSAGRGELWAGGFSSDYYRWCNGTLTESSIRTPSPNSVVSQIYHKDDFTAIIGSAGFRFIDNERIRDVDMPGGKALYVDPKGLNWIGLAALVRIDRATMYNLSTHVIHETDATMISSIPTYCVIADDHSVWAGTKKGVYRVSINNPSEQHPLPTPDGPTTILTLYQADDVLLAGTDSKGLLVYRNEKLVQELTKRSGLGSNSIYAIKPGIHPHTVFISHNAGVDQLLIEKGRCTVTNLNRALGLGQTRVNDTEIVGDTLFVATDDALLAIAARDIRGISIPPRVTIRKVTVNDTRLLANRTELPYDENEVRIFFGGI
ncbi:MAG TPA: two-component regulator propeller domain-containing protein, partial [Flavobacterium sp.]|nr:two-component regulator propeller domain-containing protein [Flavobacterium sp.]